MKNYSTDITVNETRIIIKGITWLVIEMRGDQVLLERFDKKFTKSKSREYVEHRLKIDQLFSDWNCEWK